MSEVSKSQEIAERLRTMISSKRFSWESIRNWLLTFAAELELNWGVFPPEKPVQVAYQPQNWTYTLQLLTVNIVAEERYFPTSNRPQNVVQITIGCKSQVVIDALFQADGWEIEDEHRHVFTPMHELLSDMSEPTLRITFIGVPGNEELAVKPSFAAVWPKSKFKLA